MSEAFHALATARQLAARHPAAELCCPVCATSLKAANLERHLAKVHGGQYAVTTNWRGADRGILLPLYVGFIVITLGSLGLLFALPQLQQPLIITWLVLDTLVMVLLGAAVFDKLPATLSFDGVELRVTYGLGLMRQRVRLPPARLEVGSLVERRSDNLVGGRVNAPSHDVKAGSYLRMSDEGGSVTLGCRAHGGLRKRWDPATVPAGGKLRRWHITVAPAAMVAVEYRLAQLGALTPVQR